MARNLRIDELENYGDKGLFVFFCKKNGAKTMN